MPRTPFDPRFPAPVLALALALAPATALGAQTDGVPTAAASLSYPADKDFVIAKVAGRALTLEDMVQHIGARHDPGFPGFLAEPAGQLYFRNQTLALWVRQFADIVMLEAEARHRGVDMKKAEAALAETLKRFFQAHVSTYSEQREKQGRSLELTQERLNTMLTRFQRSEGLRIELQGWLDFLTADEPTDEVLYRFCVDHARLFGGRVTFAHILIENHDRVSGRRFDQAAHEKVLARVADIRARLKEDGSNFEEVAQRFSDDRETAAKGGRLDNVARFEATLPAILCRTAWQLRDGEIAGPVESPYGLHFVKRVQYVSQEAYFLPVPENLPRIREVRTNLRQEDMIYELRKKTQLAVLY